MDEQEKNELWCRYSSVWRNVLIQVLQWPEGRVEDYIENLRVSMEASLRDSSVFGFFYDSPCRYLVRALLGDGLHEKIMESNVEDANPALIWHRLVCAVADSENESDMESPDFDWGAARVRYQRERSVVEALLINKGRV